MKNLAIILNIVALIVFSSISLANEKKNPNYFEISSPPQALNYRKVNCPTVHPEHSRLISKLKTLKNTIMSEAKGCQPTQQKSLENNLKSVNAFLNSPDRKKFFEILNSTQNKSLPPAAATFVKDYSKKATQVFSDFLVMIKNTKCFDDERSKAQALSSAANIIFETTQLVANVAGPYGAPLSIFGSLASGILSGLESYVNAVDGYDFDEKGQREAYRNVLCSYYEIRQHIANTIDPTERIEELTVLQESLLKRLEELSEKCNYCRQIIQSYLFGAKTFKFSDRKWLILAKKADDKFVQPLGQITLETINSLKWTLNEKKQLESIKNGQHSSAGPAELIELRMSFDDFLFMRQAQRYTDWSIENAEDKYIKYNHSVIWWGNRWFKTLYAQSFHNRELSKTLVSYSNKKREDNLNHEFMYQFFTDNNKYFKWPNFKFDLNANYQKSLSHFQLFHFSLKGVVEHCNFFKSMELSSRVNHLCTSRTLKNLIKKNNSILDDKPKKSSSKNALFLTNPNNRTNSTNWLDGLKIIEKNWSSNTSLFEPLE